jgi:mono/diheme cytochrome c family protein
MAITSMDQLKGVGGAEEAESQEPVVGDPVAGEGLYDSVGCSACHSTGTDTRVGPGFSVDGFGYPSDFIEESIRAPDATIKVGFDNVMPSFSYLSSQEVADLVAFIHTLGE